MHVFKRPLFTNGKHKFFSKNGIETFSLKEGVMCAR